MNKKLAAVLFVAIFGLVVGTIWWNVSLTPVNPSNKNTVHFVIARGDGVREIAKKLHDNGLIRDQVAFFILVKKLDIEKNIQAGSYKLSPSMNAEQLAKKLTVGTEDEWITIPEGWRSEQILQYLTETNPEWGKNISIDMGNQFEGKLFPDTYLVSKSSDIPKILEIMMANFSKKVDFPVSAKQLIVASLVEREARTQADRPLVASVIYNRLEAGMALDLDATVQYVIGYTKKDGWWKKELTIDDLKVESPYNTYLNAGLPPAPICNPGLSSIKAAVNPAQTDYVYYISDKNGRMHFAKTLEEHNANVARYL